MDTTFGLMLLMSALIFTPLVVFLVRALQAAQALDLRSRSEQNIDPTEDIASLSWKDRYEFEVDLPFEVVCQSVAKQLTQFEYCGGVWRIVNVDSGMPTTIAANLSAIEEDDPNNIMRVDLGLIVKISDGQAGRQVSVKLHFISYEGPESSLADVARYTAEHLQESFKNSYPDRMQTQAKPLQLAPVAAAPFMPEYDAAAPAATDVNAGSDSAFMPEYNYEPARDVAAMEPSRAPHVVPAAVPPAMPIASAPATAVASPSAMPIASAPATAVAPAPAVPVASPLIVDLSSVPPIDFGVNPIVSVVPVVGSSGDTIKPGLCPGCSQPINPSFPFCLYCSRNF